MPIYPTRQCNDAPLSCGTWKTMKVGFLLDEKGEPLPIYKADKEDRVWPNSLCTLVVLSNGVNNPTVSPLE